jgi:hypothetical protein
MAAHVHRPGLAVDQMCIQPIKSIVHPLISQAVIGAVAGAVVSSTPIGTDSVDEEVTESYARKSFLVQSKLPYKCATAYVKL